MGHADGGVDRREKSKGGEDLIVGVGAGVDDRRGKAVEGERDKAAGIAIETAGDPPQCGPQENSREQKPLCSSSST